MVVAAPALDFRTWSMVPDPGIALVELVWLVEMERIRTAHARATSLE